MASADEEIPLPKGNPATLDAGVTSLGQVAGRIDDSYLVANGGDGAFFTAAWPAGHGSTAARGEATRLAGLLRTGGTNTQAATNQLSAYATTFRTAYAAIQHMHTTWDGAETTYLADLRSAATQWPLESPQYKNLAAAALTKRDGVQNPLRTRYATTMTELTAAAHSTAGKLSTITGHAVPPGTSGSIPARVSAGLLGGLPLTNAAVEAQAGTDLGNDIKRQLQSDHPDWNRIRADIGQLRGHGTVRSDAFIHTLGPAALLQLPTAIATGVKHDGAGRKQASALLGLVANATSHYIATAPDGAAFGTALRAQAGKSIDERPRPGVAGGPNPLLGEQNLALLLSAGTNWPPAFLAGAADDIYKKERTLPQPNPWQSSRLPADRLFDQDYGNGDALVNSLHALGLNPPAAQQFFAPAGKPDEDKLHYLIKSKQYGFVAGDLASTANDNGASLGLALAAATDQKGGAASVPLTTSVLEVIAHGGGRADGGLQPAAMRPFTALILGHYMHDVDTTLGGGRDPLDPIASTIQFDHDTLEAVLKDTVESDAATNLLAQLAQQDIRHTLIVAANNAGSYADASQILPNLANHGRIALSQLHGFRQEVELHHAEMHDEDNEAIRSSVTTGIHVLSFAGGALLEPIAPIVEGGGVLASLAWEKVGGVALPTDNALHVLEHDAPALARIEQGAINDPQFARELAGRLKYLNEHSPHGVYTVDQELKEIFGHFEN